MEYLAVHVRQAVISSLKPVGESQVVQTHEVQDGRLQVVDMERVLGDVVPQLVGGADGGRTLVSTDEGTDAQQQARACTTIRDVIIRAGLDTDPAIKPSSLTARSTSK